MMCEPSGIDISIVVPVYKNKETLSELHRRLATMMDLLKQPCEFIFVDDACPEGSLHVLKEIARRDSRVAIVALGRNVGQHRAVLTGLTQVRGNWIVVLDADLQDPPEAIPRLLDGLRDGFAAVFGGRRGRYESSIRLLTAKAFRLFLHHSCGVPADAGLFVAMTRRLAESLLHFDVPDPFLVGMIGLTKLPLTSIPITRAARLHGKSGYNPWRRMRTGLRLLALVLWYRRRPSLEAPAYRRLEDPIQALIGVRYGPSSFPPPGKI